MNPKRTVVVVTDRRLFPTREGNRARIVELIRALRAEGFEIVLVARWMRGVRARYLPDLYGIVRMRRLVDRLILVHGRYFFRGSPRGFECDPYRDGIRKALARHRAVAVIAEYLWMAPCLDVVPADVLKIVDTHDVMHLRQRIHRHEPKGIWVDCTREEETELLSSADVVMAIQDREQQLFREMMPNRAVICVPHVCDARSAVRGAGPQREVVVFVGSRIQANLVGIEAFIRTAWPRILAAHPGARLEIYGDVAERVRVRGPNVHTIGYVAKLDDAYARATVVVNPVQLGTGLKIKTVEALARGRALVTTSCGADGLAAGVQQAFLVEDEMDRFGEAVQRLLRDPSFRATLESRALRFARQRFGAEAAVRELVAVLEHGSAVRPVSSGSR
jgi:glycosyltransferase involved in cell wall biosynthesis